LQVDALFGRENFRSLTMFAPSIKIRLALFPVLAALPVASTANLA
jgi:hypothetical protein